VALAIEDYAVIGDEHTAALVGRDGSIDWLCLPRFDSGACFAAILGDEDNGRWQIAPSGPVVAVRRRYRHETLVPNVIFTTPEVGTAGCSFRRSGRTQRIGSRRRERIGSRRRRRVRIVHTQVAILHHPSRVVPVRRCVGTF